MITARKIRGGAIGLALASLLGCGGGGGNDAPASTAAAGSVPDSAGASGTALVTYAQGLSQTDETSEPGAISANFAAPADDTSEPQPLT